MAISGPRAAREVEVEIPAVSSSASCSGPEEVRLSSTWKYTRLLSWGLVFLAGIFTFVMPTEALQLSTNVNVTLPLASDLSIDETTSTVFMRSGSVAILLLSSGIPCGWIVLSKLCSFLSLLLATVYWIVLVANDSFHVLREWFAVVFLVVALLFPLIVSTVDTYRAIVHARKH